MLFDIAAEFVFAASEEMSTSLVDLLTRRTRAHLFDARATLKATPAIADVVAPVYGWSDERRIDEVREYEQLVASELSAAGLTL